MPKLEAAIEVEVPFHDVDAMTVAWHGHYLKYFELARTQLLRARKVTCSTSATLLRLTLQYAPVRAPRV